jgi:hypothetical protein
MSQMTERDKSEDGSESAGGDNMHPKEPSQAELDKDRKANPDTSKQAEGSDRDAGGGGGGGGGGGE